MRLLLREAWLGAGEISFSKWNLIKDYRLEDLRSLIGYVPQDQILFAMTIRENVAFSDPQIKEEEVIKALRTCGVFEECLAMPDQMETVLGERGSLSGGQSNG